MKLLTGLLQTTRFTRSLGVALILYIFSGSLDYGMGALLFLVFSFAFNDWVDADKDALGHPHRAIPSGKITQHQSLLLSLVLLCSGMLWSAFFLEEYQSAFTIIYTLSFLYSSFLKPNLPVLATPIWSAAIAILIVRPFTMDLTAYIAVLSLMYGYELLLDYRDREADQKFCKTPTMANILGNKTFLIAGILIILGIAALWKILF